MKCTILLAVLIILMVVYSSIASPVAESTLLQKETALEKETIDRNGILCKPVICPREHQFHYCTEMYELTHVLLVNRTCTI